MQFADIPAIFNRIQGLLEEMRELWRQNSEFILGSHFYIFLKVGITRFFSLPSFYVSPFKLDIMGFARARETGIHNFLRSKSQ